MDTDLRLTSDEDEDFFLPPTPDALSVLTSTFPVVMQGEHVWIDTARVTDLALRWSQERVVPQAAAPTWYERYHFFDGTERTVNWILVLDAMNFCFWADKDQPRWRIEYQGETLNGYMAEAAALTRAVEDGIPLWDAQYLSELSSETLAHILRGEGTIPLFEQRLRNAREVGSVLLERYNGQFFHAIEEAEFDAARLALLIAQHFTSFNDVEQYRNQQVLFFKRAQICVSDLAAAFSSHYDSGPTFEGTRGIASLHHLDQLTAFADYKVPQVLRHYGLLSYELELANRIDEQELLAEGSEEEIEIRAATIWACELLRRQLIEHDYPLTAAEIDMRLWLLGQNSIEMRPYHRTRTQLY